MVAERLPQYSKDKNSIDKNIIDIKPTKRFERPTLDDVKAYCQERSNNVDAQKFFDFYSAANWVDSQGKPVKNWKQKLITWEKSSKAGQAKQCQQPSKQPSKQEEELLKMFGG